MPKKQREWVMRVGTKRQVYNGTAKQTAGGLTLSELMKNKHGKIVSKKKHQQAMRNNNLGEFLYRNKKSTGYNLRRRN